LPSPEKRAEDNALHPLAMNPLLLPLFLVLVASVFQGSFGLGMKYIKPLSWEAWWLVYSLVGMIAVPVIWALLTVPHLGATIASAPTDSVVKGVFYGFLWGIGGILFGVSISYVGVSITYGVVMGLAASAGSLIPLAQMGTQGAGAAVPYILGGVALMLVGVAICAVACVKRDQATVEAASSPLQSDEKRGGRRFQRGLWIAASCGLLSALLNVGFAAAAPVAESAAGHGALTRNSSLAAWVVVLLGATAMNAGYALWLLIRNNSWSTFRVERVVPCPAQAGRSGTNALATPAMRSPPTASLTKAYLWAIVTGLLWFGALGIYGQGAALMGSIGPVIGWPMLLGLSLIVSNVWAWRIGEWRGAAAPFRLMLGGVAVLIAACSLLGYAHNVR
jgi:L-rhamnose-H+ transport protein